MPRGLRALLKYTFNSKDGPNGISVRLADHYGNPSPLRQAFRQQGAVSKGCAVLSLRFSRNSNPKRKSVSEEALRTGLQRSLADAFAR
jgi:hypothetical protein